ncbi:MAG: hypothetical protein ACRYFU_03185 [Janthinobacterium lividum]
MTRLVPGGNLGLWKLNQAESIPVFLFRSELNDMSAPTSILVYGRDPSLLDTRRCVLERASYWYLLHKLWPVELFSEGKGHARQERKPDPGLIPFSPSNRIDERATAGQFALEMMHEIRNPLEALSHLTYLTLA